MPGTDEPRIATAADAVAVTELITSAFYDDPTWSWAFPDPQQRREQHRLFWRLFVDGALRFPWVWLSPNAASASVWIPPGETEMTPELEDDRTSTSACWRPIRLIAGMATG